LRRAGVCIPERSIAVFGVKNNGFREYGLRHCKVFWEVASPTRVYRWTIVIERRRKITKVTDEE